MNNKQFIEYMIAYMWGKTPVEIEQMYLIWKDDFDRRKNQESFFDKQTREEIDDGVLA